MSSTVGEPERAPVAGSQAAHPGVLPVGHRTGRPGPGRGAWRAPRARGRQRRSGPSPRRRRGALRRACAHSGRRTRSRADCRSHSWGTRRPRRLPGPGRGAHWSWDCSGPVVVRSSAGIRLLAPRGGTRRPSVLPGDSPRRHVQADSQARALEQALRSRVRCAEEGEELRGRAAVEEPPHRVEVVGPRRRAGAGPSPGRARPRERDDPVEAAVVDLQVRLRADGYRSPDRTCVDPRFACCSSDR